MDNYQLSLIIVLLVLVVASIFAIRVWKKRKSPQREALLAVDHQQPVDAGVRVPRKRRAVPDHRRHGR